MAEDKTKKPEQLNDEQLDEVSGGFGYQDLPGEWKRDLIIPQ